MVLRSKALGVIILVIVFGGISGASALNLWKTTSSKVPARIQQGEAVGEYNPADIRGSYQFSDVSRLFEIPLDVLSNAFGLTPEVDAPNLRLGDLESVYGEIDGKEIGTGAVKLFVALYTGVPYELPDDDYLPGQAVEILKEHASLTEQQIAFLDAHTLDISGVEFQGSVETSDTEGETHDQGERVIQGKTTFADLLAWGVPKETIAAIIGGEIPSPAMTVRIFCDENGLGFSTIKAALQAKVDNLAP